MVTSSSLRQRSDSPRQDGRPRNCSTRTGIHLLLATVLLSGCTLTQGPGVERLRPDEPLYRGFLAPPGEARPWVYWFWMNGNLTREGITADLEAMADVGIGGVLIMSVSNGIPPGPLPFMGAEWRDLFVHATREAARLGIQVNMNNDDGWTGSGGPWNAPHQSMKTLTWSRTRVRAGDPAPIVLPTPDHREGYYEDQAVLAWPDAVPGAPQAPVLAEQVLDLSSDLGSHGRLQWSPPAGHWSVLRLGFTTTGKNNHPATPQGEGLECSKLDRAHVEHHFDQFLGRLIDDVGPLAGTTLRYTHVDSWEVGVQDWTPRLPGILREACGYDPLPYLPVLAGETVGSAEVSERFRWDCRRVRADLLADEYFGALRELAYRHGMGLSVEAYGDGGLDELQCAGRADIPMAEFWVGRGGAVFADLARRAASAGHTYGRRIVAAEAFTANPDEGKWTNHPATMKALGDHMYASGINRFVFHRYAMQPWQDRFPGMTFGPHGIHYERTNTWWRQSRAWIDYLSRCQYLLQRGSFVADVLVLVGEGAPSGFPAQLVETIPEGYDFDLCTREALLERTRVEEGRLVIDPTPLPGMAPLAPMRYRLLVLPDTDRMTPELLARLRDLVRDGARILGRRPVASPSLSGFPQCDEQVERLAAEVWGDCDGDRVRRVDFGRGTVYCGTTPADALQELQVRPDLELLTRDPAVSLNWIHRRQGTVDLYFVANPAAGRQELDCLFRVSDRAPEIWDPQTGSVREAQVWRQLPDGRTRVDLHFEPEQAFFVVFRARTKTKVEVVGITRNGSDITETVPLGPLEVVSARYGLVDYSRTLDVTEHVRALVQDGGLSVRVWSTLGGDPAPNFVKTLRVVYSRNGSEQSVAAVDDQTLTIPAGPNSAGPLQILRADYGLLPDPARALDVTEHVRSLVEHEGLRVRVGSNLGGDPAPGVPKTLEVVYRREGSEKKVSGVDMETLTIPATTVPAPRPAELRRTDGRTSLLAWEPGDYVATLSDGSQQELSVPSVPAQVTVSGPWSLRFPPGWGAPPHAEMETLQSWTENADPGIRYFSGTCTYRTRFSLDPSLLRADGELVLDLGRVAVIGEVVLNQQDLGTLWKAPFRLPITGIARAGTNHLEIRVTNLWCNRLIGDESRPPFLEWQGTAPPAQWPDWLFHGPLPETGRYTFTTWHHFRSTDKLYPSGLLGPVTIRRGTLIDLSPPQTTARSAAYGDR